MGVDYYSGIIEEVCLHTQTGIESQMEKERVTTYTTTELSNQAVKWISQRPSHGFMACI